MKTKSFLVKMLISVFAGLALSSVLIFSSVSLASDGDEYVEAEGFNDVSLKHDNVKAIDYLQVNGVVEGYEGGLFKPEQNITRAEFLKIVMEVSDYKAEGKGCYSDVKDSDWFTPYVCGATKNKLVEGYSDGTFKPMKNINFVEASKIIANVLKFTSGEEDDIWYKNYVESLESKEAIPESVTSFDEFLTRAEMAEMIWRIDANRTYKLSKTYDDIVNNVELSSELKTFNSCTELHDYLEDNGNEPYYVPDDLEVEEGAIPVATMMAEKGGCFTADTQILMADDSYKAIKDVEAGDKILTKENPESSEYVEALVSDTVSHYVPAYLVINGELELTPEHVVFVNGEWQAAGIVEVGDFLLDGNGDRIEVKTIEKIEKSAWVYNLQVEEYHTYLANGYYVHNDKGYAVSEDYSKTNTQVSNVDEADTVKNDGTFIYTLHEGTVKITEAYLPENMKVVNTIEFEDQNFWPSNLYLDGDKLVVIGETYNDGSFQDFKDTAVHPAFYYSGGSVKVFVFDISDRENEKLIREVLLEGDYKSSRKVGDVLYMVVNQDNYVWPWMNNDEWTEDDLTPLMADNGKLDKVVGCEGIKYMPKQIDETNYMIVTAIPLDASSEIGKEVIMGSSSNLYASTENMYIAQEKYNWWGWYDEVDAEEETFIHKFSLDGAKIDYKGMGTVKGSILNQFSMDEYDGNFRIATTVGDIWSEDNPSQSNIFVLDENLNQIGTLEGLAKGERIYSTRFMGEKAYVVTFKKVDPLFVIGLSDATNPKVLGELKIPGFSEYLHPYDEDHIIGFGLDTEVATQEEIDARGIDFAWYQGIKMAIFDVSDVNNPVQQHIEIIGDRGTNSELNYNHKALLWSWSKGENDGALMAFPLTVTEIPQEVKDDPATPGDTYGSTVFQGAYVYNVDLENGFQFKGKITHYDNGIENNDRYFWYGDENIQRILYIGDYFYTWSQAAIKANEMSGDLAEIKRVDFASTEELE